MMCNGLPRTTLSYSGDALRSYNLRLNYVEMLESVCLALEFGVHGINM